MDQTKSKGLEALKDLKDCGQAYNKKEYNKRLATIEKELKEYEGAKNHIEALHKERVENSLKLKALEIIKRIMKIDDFLDMCLKVWNTITQEEYDLLKEVLK